MNECIAGIYFEKHRPGRVENVNFGKIIYSADNHYCSIILNGWRQCHAAAVPYDPDHHPYLNGDLNVFYEYDTSEGLVRKSQWCGYIYTESNNNSSVYQLDLDVDPTPLLINRELRRYHKSITKKKEVAFRTGLILSIDLIDKE